MNINKHKFIRLSQSLTAESFDSLHYRVAMFMYDIFDKQNIPLEAKLEIAKKHLTFPYEEAPHKFEEFSKELTLEELEYLKNFFQSYCYRLYQPEYRNADNEKKATLAKIHILDFDHHIRGIAKIIEDWRKSYASYLRKIEKEYGQTN